MTYPKPKKKTKTQLIGCMWLPIRKFKSQGAGCSHYKSHNCICVCHEDIYTSLAPSN